MGLTSHVISQDHRMKRLQLTLCMGAPHGNSLPCQVWWP